ncbi:MAG: DHA2 family efflux MFS transporter permease subunit [Actinobacteria bacterium]|nr:DHA2 family efflux MFS transporter permease subunit [Actinomycetota bacterium]
MAVLGRRVQYKYVVAAILVSALFLDILDTTIVNVALPTLGRQFGADSTEWVVVGYTLSLAVFIPVSGWLSDRVGTKRVFLFAFAMFIGASALCGAAQSIEQLIAFRVLQGVGGGMLTPVGLAMMFRVFPPAERARVSTLMMVPTLAAPALGPVIGGFLITNAGWRWIFYVNVPVGMLAFYVGLKLLREHREPTAGRFDLAGFILSGGGLASFVYALSQGPRDGWASANVLLFGLLGVTMLVGMVFVETNKAQPMLMLSLLRNRMFRNANIISAFSIASFLGLLFVLPSYLQILRGLSAQDSGLVTFPQAIGVGCSTFIAGSLYKRIGPRRLIFSGLFLSSMTIFAFQWLTLSTNLWWIRGLMVARGFCMGFAFVPMQASSYATIAPADNGRASAIFSTQRQVAISLAVAVLGTILARYITMGPTGLVSDPQRALAGFHMTFVVAGGLALLGSVAALFIRDSDAAGTMSPRR